VTTQEIIVPFPTPLLPVKRVRSTVFVGALAALKHYDLFSRYEVLLSPDHRDTVLGVVPGSWIDLDAACAHYEACQRLDLSPEMAAKLGAYNFDRIGKSLFGTMLNMAKNVGVTPWMVVSHVDRFWPRAYDGGGLRVTRRGPKEALVELQQSALADIEAYRHALRGFVLGMMGPFCTKAYARSPAGTRAPGNLTLVLQWV